MRSCCVTGPRTVRHGGGRVICVVVPASPAPHAGSDAFGQKFGREPVKVDGLDNVYCMEVETKSEGEAGSALASMLGGTAGAPGSDANEEAGGIMKTIASIATSVRVAVPPWLCQLCACWSTCRGTRFTATRVCVHRCQALTSCSASPS